MSGNFGYGSIMDENDGGGFGGPPSQGSQNRNTSDFSQLCERISNNIFKINNNATTLERTFKQIGTNSDNDNLRTKIHNTQQTTNNIIGQTTDLLKHLPETSRNKADKLQCERLKGEFQDKVKRYSSVQKKLAEKLKTCIIQPKPTHYDQYGDERSPFVEDEKRQEQLAQLQQQDQVIDFDSAIIEEREEKIRQIEADILDVNEIFRDLATLVHEQGEMVDTIENNVERAYGNVESGNQQLMKARDYQKKARKKMLCIILIGVIVAGVIAIIVYFSIKH